MASSKPAALINGQEESHAEFCQHVVQQLAPYLPSGTPNESMSGVIWQVHYTGIAILQPERAPGACARTKAAMQEIQQKVSFHACSL